MILLFAATKHRFHQRDVLNVCCFDKGEQIRFGYKRELIDPILRDGGSDSLKGDALVVFCEYIPNAEQGEFSYRFHPVRYVKIVAANENENGSYGIDIKLLGFPHYDHDSVKNKEWLDGFQTKVEGLPQRPIFSVENGNREGATVQHRFVTKPEESLLDGQTEGDWIGLVRHLGKKSDLKQCIFYRYVTVDAKQFDTIHPKATFKSNRALTSLSVTSGEIRQLSLQVLYGNDHCVREPKLSVAGIGESHGPHVRQASDGFYFDYWIAVDRTMSRKGGVLSLEVRHHETTNPELSDIYGPERYSLVHVKPKWFAVAIVVFLLAVGSALPDFVESSVWKSVGALMFALGLILAFRKMPIG